MPAQRVLSSNLRQLAVWLRHLSELYTNRDENLHRLQRQSGALSALLSLIQRKGGALCNRVPLAGLIYTEESCSRVPRVTDVKSSDIPLDHTLERIRDATPKFKKGRQNATFTRIYGRSSAF